MASKAKRPRIKRTVATMTVHGLGKMNPKQRRDVVVWLRGLATGFSKEGGKYTTGRFRAGLHYV